MTDLLKQSSTLSLFLESQEFKELTTLEKEIVLALNHSPIKDWKEIDLIDSMIQLIAKTYINCGFKFDESAKNMTNATIDEFCSDLKKYNSGITFKEIEIAFKNGWKNEYGDFFGLNNRTYFGWVNAYTWGESRLKVKKTLLNAQKNENVKPIEISEAEKEEILKKGAIRCFEEFKRTGIIPFSGFVTYNFLEKKGLINLTKEIKNEIIKKCRERLIEQEKSNLNRGLKEMKLAIENLENNSPSLIAESKRESLKLFFQNLIEMDEDLKDLL